MQKSCSIKWVKLLPHVCNKFGKIWCAIFKVWPSIKISLYTTLLLQNLFQNFGLIKFNLVKVFQYNITLKIKMSAKLKKLNSMKSLLIWTQGRVYSYVERRTEPLGCHVPFASRQKWKRQKNVKIMSDKF